jgi:hypothetical protein
MVSMDGITNYNPRALATFTTVSNMGFPSGESDIKGVNN